MKKLPQVLYVKYEQDGDTGYYISDELPLDLLTERDRKIDIGRYELKETLKAEVVVKLTPRG